MEPIVFAGLLGEERNKQFAAIPLLGQFGEAQEQGPITRLQAIANFGALPRQVEQQQKGAEFAQQLATTLFPFNQQAGLAKFLAQLKPDTFTTEPGPSELEKIASVANTFGSIFKVGQNTFGGFGGTGGTTAGAPTFNRAQVSGPGGTGPLVQPSR